MFVAQFLFIETHEWAKSWIHEKGLAIKIFDHDPDRACVEDVAEQMSLGSDLSRRCSTTEALWRLGCFISVKLQL
ncbi:MAG TPA: hypothetical protein VH596_15325 [Terriglobales bacterium]